MRQLAHVVHQNLHAVSVLGEVTIMCVLTELFLFLLQLILVAGRLHRGTLALTRVHQIWSTFLPETKACPLQGLQLATHAGN